MQNKPVDESCLHSLTIRCLCSREGRMRRDDEVDLDADAAVPS